jgi:methylmalonyl-CoA/ethylmalonyl-CoA epimerase
MKNTYPIHHIGIAVKDLPAAIKLYQDAFGFQLSQREELVSSGIELAFLEAPNTKIELIASTRSDSTLAKFLVERGEGMHHICYQVESAEAALKHFEAQGYKLIDSKPRPGAHGTMIGFLHPQGFMGVLVEVCEVVA